MQRIFYQGGQPIRPNSAMAGLTKRRLWCYDEQVIPFFLVFTGYIADF
ncbi:MAG: hypothetical protein ACLRUN_10955 [Christensenellales bacterium]